MATPEELRLRAIIVKLLDQLEGSMTCDAGDTGKEYFDSMLSSEYPEFETEYQNREASAWDLNRK